MTFLRAVAEIVYGTQDIWVGLPYVLIAGAIFVGGIIGAYTISYGIDYLILGVERANQYMRTSRRGEWRPRPKRSCRNLRHLFTLTLFFVMMAMVLWFAVATAGFNVWTTSMTALGMSVIATYVFSSSLVKLGTAVSLHLNNAIEVGQHWEFHGVGPGWEGLIISITTMDVEMARWDEESQCTETYNVPIGMFDSTMRKRNPVKEAALKHLQPVLTLDEVKEQEQARAVSTVKPGPAIQSSHVTGGGLRLGQLKKKSHLV
jgi:hypothetical protein